MDHTPIVNLALSCQMGVNGERRCSRMTDIICWMGGSERVVFTYWRSASTSDSFEAD
jgi:hypothetical protein